MGLFFRATKSSSDTPDDSVDALAAWLGVCMKDLLPCCGLGTCHEAQLLWR